MDIKESRKRSYKTLGIVFMVMFVCLLLLWMLIKPYVLKAVSRIDELTKPVAAEEVVYKDGSKVFNGDVYKTIFDGHEYIIFEKHWNTSFSMSSLHSPECPCMSKQKESDN